MGEERRMASVARTSFKACKAPGNNALRQQVRHSGGIQALAIRMKSVASIAKITKATQMVAASKLRGAEARMLAARPLTGALKDLFGGLEKSEENPEGVVPITSDKGLCGSVNTNAIKLVRFQVVPPLEEKGVNISIVSVGEKGKGLLKRFMPEKMATSVTDFRKCPAELCRRCFYQRLRARAESRYHHRVLQPVSVCHDSVPNCSECALV